LPQDYGVQLKEIILENFMSHTYSRIPLKPGLNVICGPNGAGKSSILLALAVALGQTYTERSRRLGDLIRRGKDLGRVSVVFDNSPKAGRRPVPSVDSDTLVVSRYLSQDGTYWHEVNNRRAMREEVLRLFGRLSINPDNMLIIMHQNMIDIFGAVDPKEKLKLVEEAVGFKEYRERIVEAKERLTHALSEAESTKSLFEKAQETLRYWEGEYQRFKRKLELGERKKVLELEYAWAKYSRQKDSADALKSRLDSLNSDLSDVARDMDQALSREKESGKKLKEMEFDLDASYQRLIEQERTQAELGASAKILEALDKSLRTSSEAAGQLKAEAARGRKLFGEVEGKIKSTRSAIVETKGKIEKAREDYITSRVRAAVLGVRREILEKEISSVQSDLRQARRELEKLEEEAKGVGARVATERKPQDVLDELKVINVQLATLTDVSPEVEKMYLSYKSTMKELKAKAEIAEANRKRAMEELDLRRRRWTAEITKLLNDVKETYAKILESVDAVGDINMKNPQDIDEAGLELMVGFRGAEPRVLDAYTQSGGERTTALMCFLLALQHRIKSPLRAIDEFEAHLDPRNREAVFRGIIEFMKGSETQYIVITPGQLVTVEGVPNVVTVQNIAGSSKVKVAAK
ncbi:MAG: AAA family ATPase, partial [Candidatus Hadarchaeota archaeon]